MAISATNRIASRAYWLTGRPAIPPLAPGTMEPGEMAQAQGLYAGISFSTGALATGVSYGGPRGHLMVDSRRRRW